MYGLVDVIANLLNSAKRCVVLLWVAKNQASQVRMRKHPSLIEPDGLRWSCVNCDAPRLIDAERTTFCVASATNHRRNVKKNKACGVYVYETLWNRRKTEVS